MKSDKPVLVVIGGPNGSGKTTLSSYLVQKGRIKTPVINPDEIASSEFGSYKFHVKAAREALNRRKDALNHLNDFAFETTFSGNSEIKDIKLAKYLGYQVILYYVALESVLDNATRVEERHVKLGHNVSFEDILRRYTGSQKNLVENLSLFDTAYLFDNSGNERSRVAIFTNGELSWLNPKHKNHPFFKAVL